MVNKVWWTDRQMDRQTEPFIELLCGSEQSWNLFNDISKGQRSITIATRMYASYWLVARQVPSSVGFGCAFSILCVIIVKTPAKHTRIISLEKPRKGFRPQKAYFSIPDSARPPLGTGILRCLLACLLASLLACLLACLIHFPFLAREKRILDLVPR